MLQRQDNVYSWGQRGAVTGMGHMEGSWGDWEHSVSGPGWWLQGVHLTVIHEAEYLFGCFFVSLYFLQ